MVLLVFDPAICIQQNRDISTKEYLISLHMHARNAGRAKLDCTADVLNSWDTESRHEMRTCAIKYVPMVSS